MVSAEPAGDVGSGAVLPVSPGAFCVGRDGGHPNRVHSKIREIPVFKHLRDTLKVSAQVVGLRQDGGVVHRLVVAGVPVGKPVHHQEVHGRSMPGRSIQARSVCHRRVPVHGDEDVLRHRSATCRPSSDVMPSLAKSVQNGRQRHCLVVASVVHQHVVDGHEQFGRSVGPEKQLLAVGVGRQHRRRCCFHANHGIPSAHAVGHALLVEWVQDPLAVNHPLVGVVSRTKNRLVRKHPRPPLDLRGRHGGPSRQVPDDLHACRYARKLIAVPDETVHSFAFGHDGHHALFISHSQHKLSKPTWRRRRDDHFACGNFQSISHVCHGPIHDLGNGLTW